MAGSDGTDADPGHFAPEARFSEILRIADDAIISLDEKQLITLFNRGAERIFGYGAEEILGRPLDVLLPERFRSVHGAHIDAFARSPESARVMAQRREIFGRRKDGAEFPAEASISKLTLAGRTVFTVILRDVSERMAAAAALQRAHDELEQRVRQRTAELEEKNAQLRQEVLERARAEARLAKQATELARSNSDLEQFAYVASHDLQEPLRMVASYTQLLARRYRGKLDADADDFINFVVDGALRMQQLINDLLSFSRLGTRGKQFQPVDCPSVMERVLANLGKAIEESGAEIVCHDLPTVSADDTQLVLLFQNLISNAIKFRGEASPRVEIAAERDAGEWTFSVADNGIGIDPQYVDRIFVIFQRLHGAAQYPGTGIGLAICKKIVERHGGKIWLEPRQGGGSIFRFTIPVRGEATNEYPTDTG